MAAKPNNIRYELVNYSDGTVVRIKRVPRAKMSELINLLSDIIARFSATDGAVGEMLLDDEIYSAMETICSMVPLVSNTEEYLDFERFSDNYEEVCRVFCSGSITPTGDMNGWLPPVLTKLHMLNYTEAVGKGVELAKQKREEMLGILRDAQTQLTSLS